jgi:hypothetical protein
MPAMLCLATPIAPSLSKTGVVCACCWGLDLCRRVRGRWQCDGCTAAGRTPELAQLERIARGLPAKFLIRLPPPHVVHRVVDRLVYPVVSLTAADEREHGVTSRNGNFCTLSPTG